MSSGRSSAADRLLPRAVTAVPLVAALVALVGFPLLDLTKTALSDTSGWDSALDVVALRNSLVTSLSAAFLAAVCGTSVAMVVERSVDRTPWLRLVLLLPLLIPPFVSALSWSRAFGPGGLTDDLVGWTLPGLYGPVGIVAVLAVHATPLVYLVVGAALATRARPEVEWAARVSGATPRVVLRRIALPALAPAVLAGALLAFVVSLNSFGVPAVLGVPAGYPTITTRIFSDLARSADPEAFARVLLSALVLVGLVVVASLGAATLLRRPGREASAGGHEPLPAPGAGRGRGVVWLAVAVTVAVPLIALVLTALTRAVGLDPLPGNWTMANFSEAWSGDTALAAARSVALAALAATACVALGVLLVVGHRRTVRGWEVAVASTFAVPGSALAVAFLLAYGPWLRDTVLIILLAYVAKFWALAQRTLAGSAAAGDGEARRAARVSGATGPATLRRVVLPMLRPAMVAAWLIVFLFAIHELTISSLLYGPGTATLAVATLEVQQLGDPTVTAALAVLLSVPGVVAAVLGYRRWRMR